MALPGWPQPALEPGLRRRRARLGPASFRILCIVDDFTREALALVVDTSIGGASHGARAGRADREARASPAMIVSDNGTEMTSRAMLEWANRTGVDWHYIAPRQWRPKFPHIWRRKIPQLAGSAINREGDQRLHS